LTREFLLQDNSMHWEVGKKYFFIIHYTKPEQLGVVLIRYAGKEDSNQEIVMAVIEKIFTPKIKVGWNHRIIEGKHISTNELQGAGAADKADKYFFHDPHIVIGKIFHG
jgi:hypothetical protein